MMNQENLQVEKEIIPFMQFPRALQNNPKYTDLSITARYAFMLLYDRASLSKKNGWLKNGKIFILYKKIDLAEDMNISRSTLDKCLNELKSHHLIVEEVQPKGVTSCFYVIIPEETVCQKSKKTMSKNGEYPCPESKYQCTKSGHINKNDFNNTNTTTETVKETEEKPDTKQTEVVVNFDDGKRDILRKRLHLIGISLLRIDAIFKQYTLEYISKRWDHLLKRKASGKGVQDEAGYFIASLEYDVDAYLNNANRRLVYETPNHPDYIKQVEEEQNKEIENDNRSTKQVINDFLKKMKCDR